MDANIRVKSASKDTRERRWVPGHWYSNGRRAPGYFNMTLRQFQAKPRLYVGIEDESVLENFAYRTNRPTAIYRQALPEILRRVGLPVDTKAVWNQKAGCSCGCSPGFVLDVRFADDEMPYDVFATLIGAPKVKDTPEATAEAMNRAEQLAAQI